jgi:cyanophycinase
MSPVLRPIYLLSDSQLLFWKDEDQLFLEAVVAECCSERPRAAYVGVANGDVLQYYEIFTAAMDGVGVRDRQLISASFTSADESFLNEADLILLAGGDVELGWRTMNATGMAGAIMRRFRAGAVLMGVSAGAIYLGRHAFATRGDASVELIETFNFLPCVVAVHDEEKNWEELGNLVRLLDGGAVGIGIPSGGGLVYFPDGTLQPIRHSVYEVTVVAGQVRTNLLLPL